MIKKIFIVWLSLIFFSFFGLEILETNLPTDLNNILLMSSQSHIFGTDELGRDYFLRCIFGLSLSIIVGSVSASISVLIGVTLGFFSGYYQGKLDFFLMRFFEVVGIIPHFLLITFVIFMLNPWMSDDRASRLICIGLAIGVSSWTSFAKFIRAQVMTIAKQEFILSAKAIGASNLWLLRVHLLPHILREFVPYLIGRLPSFLLMEGFLSFLGFGLHPPEVSIGTLLSAGWRSFAIAPHLLLFPGLLLTVFILLLRLASKQLNEFSWH